MAAAVPVVLLGEIHNRTTHYQVERDTLCHVQAAGYDTLALEWPRDFEPALQTYLASNRTQNDYEIVLQKWYALREAAASNSCDPDLYRKGSDASFLKTIWLAEDAKDLGYAVRCVDSLSLGRLPQRGENETDWMNRRNADMAEKIAEAFRDGHRLVVEAGTAHLMDYKGSTSLSGHLKQKGIPVEGFEILGIGSINPASCRAPATNGRSVAEFIGRRYRLDGVETASFQRSSAPSLVSQLGLYSRQQETLQRSVERDRGLGLDSNP